MAVNPSRTGNKFFAANPRQQIAHRTDTPIARRAKKPGYNLWPMARTPRERRPRKSILFGFEELIEHKFIQEVSRAFLQIGEPARRNWLAGFDIRQEWLL